ncbi:MAG: helix-turn-helix domain-containing protein [Sphingomonadaceae bacterium]
MAVFAQLLKGYREGSGLSQRALARASQINPAIISRLESGDREPSGPEQVLAIARALGLDPERTDALLSSAGHWPRAILELGPSDESLLMVARVLTGPHLEDAAKVRFRRIVSILAEQWLDSAR